MIAILMLLCCSTRHDTVDVWERNRVVCPMTGNEILTQHVWWNLETHGETTDHFVLDWRLEKDVRCRPARIGDRWVGSFRDGKNKCRRTITARVYVETETTVDFEREDATRLPIERRRGLNKS